MCVDAVLVDCCVPVGGRHVYGRAGGRHTRCNNAAGTPAHPKRAHSQRTARATAPTRTYTVHSDSIYPLNTGIIDCIAQCLAVCTVARRSRT